MSLDLYIQFEPCKCCNFQRPELHFNITHNLTEMAHKAGICECLWHPNENNMFFTDDIIFPLTEGLAKLKAMPAYYKQFDSDNGWGTYDNFVPFVEEVLDACIANKNCKIVTSI